MNEVRCNCILCSSLITRDYLLLTSSSHCSPQKAAYDEFTDHELAHFEHVKKGPSFYINLLYQHAKEFYDEFLS